MIFLFLTCGFFLISFCRFSTCWPAFQKETNGVVIVYNPDQANHDKELETWYDHGYFNSHCTLCLHEKGELENCEHLCKTKSWFNITR